MPDVQIGLLIFIVLVVGVGGGWFIYEANRSDDE
jgi:uncharacterized protein YneF (UPF0154 family)